MTSVAMEIRKNVRSLSFRARTPTKSLKEAWAAWARRRWPTNCQANLERAFDLSPGRAHGVVWTGITLPTIEHIIDHPNGGLSVWIEVEAIRRGLELDAFFERIAAEEREAIADERRQFEAREARVVALEAMATARRRHARDDHRQGAVLARQADAEPGTGAAGLGRAEAVRPGGDLALYDNGED